MDRKITVRIYLTWSKLMALILLILGFTMDLLNDRSGAVFMFCVPFFAAMITGRQAINSFNTTEKNDGATKKENND